MPLPALLFPEIRLDEKCRQRRRYRYETMPSYEQLSSLPNADQYLKPGVTVERLDQLAHAMTGSQAASQLNTERKALFVLIHKTAAA